jgi:TPR repeat protein
MFAIGNLFANGFGVGKDLDEAMKWYCKAALLGHPQARTMVGQENMESTCGSED